jgi:hypothetical protein
MMKLINHIISQQFVQLALDSGNGISLQHLGICQNYQQILKNKFEALPRQSSSGKGLLEPNVVPRECCTKEESRGRINLIVDS